MVLHNILIDLEDDPTDIEGYDGTEDAPEDNEIPEGRPFNEDAGYGRGRRVSLDAMDEGTLFQTGLYRRKMLLRLKHGA